MNICSLINNLVMKRWIQFSVFILILGRIYAATNIDNHPAWQIIDDFDCGESASDRIIGGDNAALGQFPWIVRLGYIDEFIGADKIQWLCGGSLITDRHVVTAAHCLTNLNSDIELKWARVGEHDMQSNPDCVAEVCAPPVQDRKIRRIIPHEKFDKPQFHNDIAFMELDVPVELNQYVTPVCLPKGQLVTQIKVKESITVAGWGMTNMTTENYSDILQFIQLPVIEPRFCNSFGKSFKLSPAEICAGAQQNRDACSGDSGGPVMKVYDTDQGPKSHLVGVVSFGPTICGIQKPGVYTSVSHYLKWILDKINP